MSEARLIAERRAETPPFLSIAIPQYNRRRHLEVVLESVFAQGFDDYEVVVSDDCSADDSAEAIPPLLEASGRPFRYLRHDANVGYDANVRRAIDNAQGRYVMLLANDDVLPTPETLASVVSGLERSGYPEVAVTNYVDVRAGERFDRALETQVIGSGVPAALAHYRNFSFVSGILYDRALAQRHRDEMPEGPTIFYQVLIACRILAAGGRLGAIAVDAVHANIQVDDEYGRIWSDVLADAPRSFEARDNLSGWLLLAVQRGVMPFVAERDRSRVIRRIIVESLVFSLPMHTLHARRLIRWSFAFGYVRGMWPGTLFTRFVDGEPPRLADRLRVWAVYLPAAVAGLVLPASAILRLRPRLAAAVRRRKAALGGASHPGSR